MMSLPANFLSVENNKSVSLGKPLSIHRRQKLSWLGFGGFVLIGALITLGPLSYGLYRYYFGYTHYGRIAASTWSQPWYLLALLGIVLFGILVQIAINRSRHFIAVHDNGVHMRTNKSILIPWVAICGLSHHTIQPNFLKLSLNQTSQAYLFLANGTRIRIDHRYDKFESLLTLIRNAIYPHQHAKYQEDFYSGKWVAFGSNIMVHISAMKIQDRQIPWRNIHRVSIKEGFLVVELANLAQVKIPVINIPNLELLLKIVQAGVDG